MNEDFSFEHQWQMSEDEFQLLIVQIGGHPSRKKRPFSLAAWTTLWALLGVALLFVPYVSALGVLILLVVLAVVFRRPLWRWIQRFNSESERAHTIYLHEPVRLGLDETGFWIQSSTQQHRTSWPALFLWEIRDGWLRLAPATGPQAYFPIAALEQAGVFEQVMAKARTYGGEYDTPSALRRQRELRRAAV